MLEGIGVNFSVCIRYGFRLTPKTTKNSIKKVSKLTQLILRKYRDIDNFLYSDILQKW